MIKKRFKIFIAIALLLALLLIISFINHKIQLTRENSLFLPEGTLVEINGYNMNVYTEGEGSHTLIFMSGGGTCSPVLDFKSLYSLLSDTYKIVVIEKFGYGYSDVINTDRTIDSVLENSRLSLRKLGIKGPFVLCPHSISGIEALYWAQKYPDEVEAIIGLDMSVPEAYENLKISIPIIKLGQFISSVGLIRFIPGIAESDAIKYGSLSEDEKKLYRAFFYRRFATSTMIIEATEIKNSAKKVGKGVIPQCPMLFFISNAKGTGWDSDSWKSFQINFASKKENATVLQLECSHYVHNHCYKDIASYIKDFLK